MFVAKWYTRASRVRILIAKFDGRWKIPGGPFPIPELVALVSGLLITLFTLPTFGDPLLTGVVGGSITVAAVAVMRRMPYSPVKFSTRLHRIIRLYTSPISSTGSDHMRTDTVSTVRPAVAILDGDTDTMPSLHPAGVHALVSSPTATDNGWDELFEQPHSAAAELFT